MIFVAIVVIVIIVVVLIIIVVIMIIVIIMTIVVVLIIVVDLIIVVVLIITISCWIKDYDYDILMPQEKACLVSAPSPPARTKSYQAPSPLPAKIALVRSASETQAVVEKEKVEEVVVKEEVLWTDEMVQDMFDCLDQVRDYLSQHHGQLVMI